MYGGCEDGKLGGLFPEQRMQCSLRIALDYQAFLGGTAFTLFTLWTVFLGHVRLLSQMFLLG
jgi:hypothetical protein